VGLLNKIASLRQALIETNTYFATAPETLHVYAEEGTVHANLKPGLHFAYAYTIRVLVTDFPGHPDSLFVPLIGWVKRHQPDLLQNPAQENSIRFEIELQSATTADIAISLPVSESVVVKNLDGVLQGYHKPDPVVEEFDEFTWNLYINGVHIPWPPSGPLPLP